MTNDFDHKVRRKAKKNTDQKPKCDEDDPGVGGKSDGPN